MAANSCGSATIVDPAGATGPEPARGRELLLSYQRRRADLKHRLLDRCRLRADGAGHADPRHELAPGES